MPCCCLVKPLFLSHFRKCVTSDCHRDVWPRNYYTFCNSHCAVTQIISKVTIIFRLLPIFAHFVRFNWYFVQISTTVNFWKAYSYLQLAVSLHYFGQERIKRRVLVRVKQTCFLPTYRRKRGVLPILQATLYGLPGLLFRGRGGTRPQWPPIPPGSAPDWIAWHHFHAVWVELKLALLVSGGRLTKFTIK